MFWVVDGGLEGGFAAQVSDAAGWFGVGGCCGGGGRKGWVAQSRVRVSAVGVDVLCEIVDDHLGRTGGERVD